MGKSKQKISNWKLYNLALVKRGSLTLWMDEQAIKHWHCQTHHGRRGRGFHYSDRAIETALMLKSVFKLPLRALEGFINSLFQLMDVPLQSPDYSCISKRAKQVNIQYRLPSKGPVAHLVIDATGLKVYGDGEWKVRKHGKEKRRVWRKLHLAVDANTHAIVAAEVSLETVGDNEVLPTLLNRLRRKIEQVSADGAYDTKECHALLKRKGARATIPPRKNAALWEEGHPRNEAVLALKAGELKEWKRASGYHQRSKAETAMYRFKQLISSKLSLRNYNAQVGEALAGVKAMNKMTVLGMPVRQLVN
ncbi:IS5 family transposase [Aeromonas salmonicida subsp. achromogenes]|uniref:IS5 family transposase n=1 Tax=Aeromonas salmonicida TaxID=645 RepID=UPI00110FBB8B|nr:IS5 family transposase [Aeromonas salmonicida]TMX14577.1 IS5 family transposase [Aeromonas salmonicida subsp. achromogenes]TMX18122.1 IS5 family transposase [Aeromonas salmonicida subsp. achromogenes]TMX18843.1 IS5 family transposase [Aeromonas salmonicida subsp. achromogenes]TMX21393.1 IS5 family transposase [Aeromonas salmonicida subsp. achromogenes]